MVPTVFSKVIEHQATSFNKHGGQSRDEEQSLYDSADSDHTASRHSEQEDIKSASLAPSLRDKETASL